MMFPFRTVESLWMGGHIEPLTGEERDAMLARDSPLSEPERDAMFRESPNDVVRLIAERNAARAQYATLAARVQTLKNENAELRQRNSLLRQALMQSNTYYR